MSHLQASVENIGDFERDYEVVGVGASVVYTIQAGRMRQGRTDFPAFVLKQHPDDGALDLMIFLEPEDMLMEQRVLPKTEIRDGHCWSPVIDKPVDKEEQTFMEEMAALRSQIFADFEAPPKAVMEYLADFDERLRNLEARVSPTAAKRKKD